LLCTYQIEVSFDPQNPAACPQWIKFQQEVVQIPEVILEYQEFFGYCLSRETRYEKALLLVGPGADGKSTALNVLQALVGKTTALRWILCPLEMSFTAQPCTASF
jgi:putative DNA primase/helicase